MRRLATFLVLATAFSFHRAVAAPDLRAQLALAEKAEDTYSQIEIIRRILDKEPGDAKLQEDLVRLWMQIEDYDMAETALRDWKAAPEGLKAEIAAEILSSRDDKTADAVALLEAYRAKDPADMTIIRQLARYLDALHDREKLIALLDTASGVSGEADLLLTRAGAKRSAGSFEGALADFALVEQADAEIAKPARPSYERLKIALPQIQAANARVEKSPDDFAALITRAQLLSSISAQPDLIRADVERAWKAAPQSAAARILYARTVLSPSKARADLSVDTSKEPAPESIAKLLKLDETLAANPKDAAALAARCFELNDAPVQYELALLDADAALAIDPANVNALVEKIYAYIKLGKVPEAASTLIALEKIKAPPNRLAHAYGYLAEGEMAIFRFDAALDYANRGIKAQPSASLYQTRAAILNRLGRISESNADLASAKKLEKK